MTTQPSPDVLRAVADALSAADVEHFDGIPAGATQVLPAGHGALDAGFVIEWADHPDWWLRAAVLLLRVEALGQEWQARRAQLQAALDAAPEGIERFNARERLEAVDEVENHEAYDLLEQAMGETT